MFTLLTANKTELEKGIPIASLNLVFQDAILTTRRLGVKYLWIDCLCIIQDATDMESSCMGEVYKYGYCNISAIKSSKHGSDRCYTDRNPLTITPLVLKLRLGQWYNAPRKTKQYCVHRGLEEWGSVEIASLNTRGWVLQERLMSPRTIYFGSDRIFFECRNSKASETWPDLIKLPRDYRQPSLKHEQGVVDKKYLLSNGLDSFGAISYWARLTK